MPRSETPPEAHLPAPAAGLIPHRRPVRLIETLLAADGCSGRAEALLRENPLFVAPDGRVDPAAHLELIAQTFAAARGWHDREVGIAPRTGYLVGIQNLSFRGAPRIGDRITVAVQETERIGSLVAVQGDAYHGERLLARGRLKLWLAPPGGSSSDGPPIEAETTALPLMPWNRAIADATIHPLEWETEQTITQSFCFPAAFCAFQGHFPGHPVLPAFAQVRLAAGMLASARRRPLSLTGLDKAKFREPLLPGQIVRVRCRLEERPAAHVAAATLTLDDRTLSAFQVTVAEMMPTTG